MSGPPPLTAREYVAAFERWRALARHNTPRGRVGWPRDQMDAVLDALVGGGCAAVLAAFPDDEPRAPEAYCAAFSAHLGERAPEDERGVRELSLAIRKSCLLDRLLHLGEAPRTVPCPKHGGRWSGCHFHLDDARCPHGCGAACGCNTGWLRADEAPSSQEAPRGLPEGLSTPGPDGMHPAGEVVADVVALSTAGFRVWSYPLRDVPDALGVALHVGRAGFDVRRAVTRRYEGGHMLVACGDRVPGAPDLTDRGIEEGGPA